MSVIFNLAWGQLSYIIIHVVKETQIFYKGSASNHQGVYALRKLILLARALEIFYALERPRKATSYHMFQMIFQKIYSKRFRNRARIHIFLNIGDKVQSGQNFVYRKDYDICTDL